MPIDKFTIGEYIEEEDSLLEYVQKVANEFSPSLVHSELGELFISNDDSQAPFQFIRRYNARRLNTYFKYQDYMRTNNLNDIQNIIQALGIDSEKFWYLLLFVSDFVVGSTLNTLKVQNAPKDDLKNFSEFIKQNKAGFCQAKGITFKNPISLILQIKGKRLVIENPNTLYYIANLCEKAIEEIQQGGLLNIGDMTTDYSTSTSEQIALFAKMLLFFFKSYPQFDNRRSKNNGKSKSKLLLISRLAYFTRLTRNESYLEDDDNIKKIIKQYKDRKIQTINNFYFI